MKKSIMMKIFGVMVIVLMFVFVSTYVLAVEDDFEDLLNNGTSTNNTDDNDSNEIGTNNDNDLNKNNNTNTNNANSNANPLSTNGLGTNNNTNNTNSYDNTSLPSTGIQDSIPTVLLVVVFGVSAVYAYKKIKDYQQL